VCVFAMFLRWCNDVCNFFTLSFLGSVECVDSGVASLAGRWENMRGGGLRSSSGRPQVVLLAAALALCFVVYQYWNTSSRYSTIQERLRVAEHQLIERFVNHFKSTMRLTLLGLRIRELLIFCVRQYVRTIWKKVSLLRWADHFWVGLKTCK
jgi:hypothetical protein